MHLLLKPAARRVLAEPLTNAFHSCAYRFQTDYKQRRLDTLHKHWAQQMLKPEPEWIDPVLGKQNVPFILRVKAELGLPQRQVDAINADSTELLISGAEAAFKQQNKPVQSELDGEDDKLSSKIESRINELDAQKREAVRRIVSLRNSNESQAKTQAIQFAVKEFQRFEGDTGSPEVQAAVATIKIHYMVAHAKEAKKDAITKHSLENLVQRRRRILVYLRRVDPKRYLWTLEKLGLVDDSVCAEFHMSRKYLWKVKFYGDKTLAPKITKRDTLRQQKQADKDRKAERYLAEHNPEVFLKRAGSIKPKTGSV